MITITQDFTDKFNANSAVNLDISGWDYVVVQFVTPTGTVTFNSTNDGGAVTGSADPNPESATNWVAVQGKNLNTGSGATTVAASSIFQFSYIGRFLQLTGTAITVTKLIISFNKID